MTVANLGLAVDSKPAAQGATELNRLTAAAEGAEAAARRLAGATEAEAAAQTRATATGRMHAAALQAEATAARLSAIQQRNLIFQLNDVVVSAASGMSLQMIAIQQGSQIFQNGIGSAFRSLGTLATNLLTKFWPIGIAIGALTAGFAAMTTEINRNQKTQVNMGDVMVATWELATESILRALKPVTDWFGDLWNMISPHIALAVNGMIGAFDNTIRDIGTLWKTLPSIVGEAAIDATNVLLGGLDNMLDASKDKTVAWLKDVGNLLGPMLGGAFTGAAGALGMMPRIDADPLPNPYRGSREKAEAELRQNTLATRGTNYIDLIGDRARDVHNRPSDEEMKKAAKEVDRQAKAYSDLVRSAEQRIAQSQMEVTTLGMTREAAAALRYEQELLNKAANDNINLSPKQVAELGSLATAMAAAEETARSLKEIYDFGKSTFNSFFSDIKSGLKDGTTGWEAFANAGANALDRIADRALSMAADGIFDMIFGAVMGGVTGGGGLHAGYNLEGSGGGIGGILSGLFGHNANGTSNWGGGLSWVGEQGPELVNLPRGAQVFDHQRSAAMAANSNAANNNTVVQIIDQRSGGTIRQERATGPNGEKIVRAIIRDEVREAGRRGALGF